jgi:DNA-binding transcriptional LysR family regulator
MIPDEVTTASVASGQLVPVMPRYRLAGGGIYVVWPSQKLVPAPVVAAREMLIEELTKSYE